MLRKAESFKAHELFWLDVFAFPSSICCSNRQCYCAFLISPEFASSISFLSGNCQRDLVIIQDVWNVAFTSLSLGLHFWICCISPSQFWWAFPDHANPGTLCGCNSYQLIRGFWGVNDELQHVSLEDQRLQPVRHWRDSCETKALAYGWCVLFPFFPEVI